MTIKYYREHRATVLAQQKEYQKVKMLDPEYRKRKEESQQRMAKKYPEKYKARYLIKNAVMLGKITKKPCEVCGAVKVESHHDDYSKPFDVRWLCHRHHCELEGRWIPRN